MKVHQKVLMSDKGEVRAVLHELIHVLVNYKHLNPCKKFQRMIRNGG